MPSMTRRLTAFDTRSVMLFAALAFGGASMLHAQQSPKTPPTFGPGTGTTAPASPSNGGASPFTVGPGAAQGAPGGADAAFTRADTNGDGLLSAAEAAPLAAIGPRFRELDTDGDGMLSREEFLRGAGS